MEYNLIFELFNLFFQSLYSLLLLLVISQKLLLIFVDIINLSSKLIILPANSGKNSFNLLKLLYCLIMISSIPFFLPKIHERYTFGADVLSLVLAVFAPGRRILLPLCFGFASYAAYTAGLPGEKILDLKWAAMFQMVGVALTAAELWRALNTDRQNAALAEVKA